MTNIKHRYISLIIGSAFAVSTAFAPLAVFAQDNGNDNDNNSHGNKGLHIAIGHAKNTPPGNAYGRERNDPKPGNASTSNGWSGFWNNWFDNHAANAATTTGSIAANGNLPPVISGVSSPTTLAVGATGTWTVSASDPQNGNLNYSVDWGDNAPQPIMRAALLQPIFTQTATFTHIYSAPGTYTVKFAVKDDAGLVSNTSVTVHVTASESNEGAPVISNLSATSSAPTRGSVSWTTSERTKSILWYSTTTPVDASSAPSIVRNIPTVNHKIDLNGLTGGTAYYVLVQAMDDEGMDSTSTASFTTPLPASLAPSIGSFTGPASIQALVQGTWAVVAADPNNSSLSYSVDWGDTPFMMALARIVRPPIFVQTSTFDHTYANPGTYTITITAQNTAGLKATATTSVVVTAASTTAAAPVLVNGSVILGSSGLTASWTTDENADSEIYYSTTTPVVIGASSTTAVADSTLATSHSLSVTGLTPSTTYYFVIRSESSGGNGTASPQFSLTTLAI